MSDELKKAVREELKKYYLNGRLDQVKGEFDHPPYLNQDVNAIMKLVQNHSDDTWDLGWMSGREDMLEYRVRPLETEKDAAYAERNQVVAALSKLFPSVKRPDGIGWWVVYITLPTGQVSWHFKTSEMGLLTHVLPHVSGDVWDGHSTEEKYARLNALNEVAQ